MAEHVPAANFNPAPAPAPSAAPPAPGTQPTQASGGNPVPIVPGQPAPQGSQPQAPQAPAQEPQGDLAAAIAALTAALGNKGDGEDKGSEVPAEPQVDTNVGDLNDVDVGDIDDPLLRSMAVAIRSGAPADLDMNRVLARALERGDATLIDRAYLVEKCGKDAAHRIQIAEGIVEAVNRKSSETAKAVYAAAGGQEQWNACTAAFNKAAPAALRTVVIQMMNSGNSDQVGAASQLVVEFAKGQGFVPNSAGRTDLTSHVGAQQALSKGEFQAELRKLDPNARDYQEQRGSLFQRRELGKKLGK